MKVLNFQAMHAAYQFNDEHTTPPLSVIVTPRQVLVTPLPGGPPGAGDTPTDGEKLLLKAASQTRKGSNDTEGAGHWGVM